ncbi:MAG: hypothetical protein DRI46_06675 [Chloroflexi bacterium]|nr:MAG: hypothetical protein DRI46_06675 [Chloroflexota bacterium]
MKQTNKINIDNFIGIASYHVTPQLRYMKKDIRVDEHAVKTELRLQQMWQGSDGSQGWEWVEEVDNPEKQ